jgi:hypothetical protein
MKIKLKEVLNGQIWTWNGKIVENVLITKKSEDGVIQTDKYNYFAILTNLLGDTRVVSLPTLFYDYEPA